MTPSLRIPRSLLNEVSADLKRTHPIAAERVGFLFARPDSAFGAPSILLAVDYWPVPDDGYVDDYSVGAKINEATIRQAMQTALATGTAAFHVHEHDWIGTPSFSPTDEVESARLMPCFLPLVPELPHGALIIGRGGMCGKYWMKNNDQRIHCAPIPRILIVGFSMQLHTP